MSIFLLILGIILFVSLVVAHEWGHYIMARRNGVEVEEFGIGFPPKVWGKNVSTKKSKFFFSVNLLPLGGFVRLKGENDSDTRKGSFGNASLPIKVKIMLAGVVMNLIVAFLAITVLALFGLPKLIDNQFTVKSDTKIVQEVQHKGSVIVATVVNGSPADKAGIKNGDQIKSFDGQLVTNVKKITDLSKQNAGKTAQIVVLRSGQTVTTNPTLNDHNSGEGYLGVASESGEKGVELRRSTWSAPIVGAGIIAQFTEQTYKGLAGVVGNLFKGETKQASQQVTGPVGIVVILKEGSKLGLNFVLMFIAVISLILALMNVLPIPALDGGRLFVTLLFRAMNKPLTKKTEERIHGTGMAVLLALFVLITVVDIKRFF